MIQFFLGTLVIFLVSLLVSWEINKDLDEQQPYRGIVTGKGKLEGLYPIESTGVSTGPILEAAEHFLNALSPTQREKVSFPIDADEWHHWSNVDNGIFNRQGVSLKEMSKDQKIAAFSLMEKSLSAKGLKQSKDIMKTDHTLKELRKGADYLDEELYFFTVMGTPSATNPWGWQLDGHHLVINYFVLGDQVVMTPVFMGAEPVTTTSGKYAGNTLFQDEQNQGLDFMQSLSEALQTQAILSERKNTDNIQGEAFSDNLVLNYQGLKTSQLSAEKKEALLDLVGLYIGNLREGHQQIRMEEVRKHLDDTWFAWVGEISEDAVFYYRIHSPVILIEFDHQRPVGVPSLRRKPTRNHIHTVVRTPNGNDYVKDLLRQHLELHHHD